MILYVGAFGVVVLLLLCNPPFTKSYEAQELITVDYSSFKAKLPTSLVPPSYTEKGAFVNNTLFDLLGLFVSDGDVVIDAFGGYGLNFMQFANLVGEDGAIIAIEYDHYDLLHENARACDMWNRTLLVYGNPCDVLQNIFYLSLPVALGRNVYSQSISLIVAQVSSGLCPRLMKFTEPSRAAMDQLGNQRLYSALMGSMEVLIRCRPIIYIEFNSNLPEETVTAAASSSITTSAILEYLHVLPSMRDTTTTTTGSGSGSGSGSSTGSQPVRLYDLYWHRSSITISTQHATTTGEPRSRSERNSAMNTEVDKNANITTSTSTDTSTNTNTLTESIGLFAFPRQAPDSTAAAAAAAA
eukprot:CAMPEP_0174964110 /NCGR_PEP_ID=MMETSP0004_2-20121128/5699_1 /TAXON_ID=420556 /ORGANISM="Ochromonas sp., Strain CCMP1393" /LENGTH=354 /DNA_ID=CAMNT_0016212801 /DNA_START=36 /DNA_END=1096 /DNA_ORIENTATION=+